MNNYDLIYKAISNKMSITCFYNGYLRKMTPHVLGTKNGGINALFLQYDGGSSKGLGTDLSKNWRCIPINDITDMQINNDGFYTANNHSKAQSCVELVDVEIDY